MAYREFSSFTSLPWKTRRPYYVRSGWSGGGSLGGGVGATATAFNGCLRGHACALARNAALSLPWARGHACARRALWDRACFLFRWELPQTPGRAGRRCGNQGEVRLPLVRSAAGPIQRRGLKDNSNDDNK